MEELLTAAVIAFAALFPVVDPIGNVPTFLALTRRYDRAGRLEQARKATIASVVVLVVFLLAGHFVLDFFEVSLAAVEFVGGLVIGYVGWEMLIHPLPDPEQEEAPPADQEVFFNPLAFPLLAGPGALAIVLGLSNRHDSWLDYTGFSIGIAAVMAVAFLAFSQCHRVLRVLGPKGVEVLNRVMGLIVLAIAAELIFHGISDHFGLELEE